MPCLPEAIGGSAVSEVEEAIAEDWLRSAAGVQLTLQTLHQQGGFAITLLRLRRGGEEPGEIEDAYVRFSRPGDR